MEEHNGFKMDQPNSKGNTCWGCGHWLIGGGCWKEGNIHMPGWKGTNPEDSCEEWVDEDSPGTITAQIAECIEEMKEDKRMDIQEFAKMLDGRYEGEEITKAECGLAEELGFVILFGYSDDCAEFRGAINDEIGCFDGGEVYVDKSGIFEGCEDNCKYSQAAMKECKLIEIEWDDSEGEYAWTYKTDIPHATFTTLDEEGNKFCNGIVFDIKEL